MTSTDSTLQTIEGEAAAAALRRATLLLAISASIASIVLFLFDNGTRQYAWAVTYPVFMLTTIGWVSHGLSHWVRATTLALVVVIAMQAVTFFAIVSYGSISASASVIMLSTVVAAGIFMTKRALLLAWLMGVTLLGVAAYAEMAGWIALRNPLGADIAWITHATVMSAVALVMLYARERTRSAYEQQFQILKENTKLADERDRSLEHFTRIFRTSPSPMVALMPNTGKIVDVNPAFEHCFGFTKADMLGQSDHQLWADPAQRQQHLICLQTTKHAETLEAMGRRADGSQLPVQIRSEWGSEVEGSLVITTVTDMTEHHLMLSRLRRSEERFAKAFHLSPLNLIITRQNDDSVVEINHAEGFLDPAVAPNSSGLPASQVGPWFTPTDRERFVECLKGQGNLHGFEAPMVRPDGSTIDAKVWAEQIEIDEEPCILSCVVDATEEKRREMLLHNIAKGMSGHTAEAFFKALTEQMAQALGADMVLIGELIEAQTITTLSVSQPGERTSNFAFSIAGKLCEKSLEQREPLIFSANSNSGEKWTGLANHNRYETVLCQALHDAEGHPIGLLNAFWIQPTTPSTDMVALMAIFASRANAELMRLRTERKIEQLNESLEQRVRARTRELLKLNAELDSFAYSISHDLKSPLRAIDGFTQLLSERLQGRIEPEDQHLMTRILGATHRMATLMADLLALTRINQQPLHIERINVSLMAKEALEQCLEHNPRPGLKWHIALGLVTHADARLTRTVLKNLLENAVKYTRDQAHPVIEVGRALNADGAHGSAEATFFVRDNGAGFSMDHADKLFKPFQRLHMPSAGFDGTGIGLATVRRIVERHGGSIEAKAAAGAGAEFQFNLGADATP